MIINTPGHVDNYVLARIFLIEKKKTIKSHIRNDARTLKTNERGACECVNNTEEALGSLLHAKTVKISGGLNGPIKNHFLFLL